VILLCALLAEMASPFDNHIAPCEKKNDDQSHCHDPPPKLATTLPPATVAPLWYGLFNFRHTATISETRAQSKYLAGRRKHPGDFTPG